MRNFVAILLVLHCLSASAQSTKKFYVGAGVQLSYRNFEIQSLQDSPAFVQRIDPNQFLPGLAINLGNPERFNFTLSNSFILRNVKGSTTNYSSVHFKYSFWMMSIGVQYHPFQNGNFFFGAMAENGMMVIKYTDETSGQLIGEPLAQQFPLLGFNLGYRIIAFDKKSTQYSLKLKGGYSFSTSSLRWHNNTNPLLTQNDISLSGPWITLLFEGWFSSSSVK